MPEAVTREWCQAILDELEISRQEFGPREPDPTERLARAHIELLDEHALLESQLTDMTDMRNAFRVACDLKLDDIDILKAQLAAAQKDMERLDWLEYHEIPTSSPHPDSIFRIGEIAKFPWGAARLEKEIPHGLHWIKVDWREAIDAARSAPEEPRSEK